jgi:hypothetical protein
MFVCCDCCVLSGRGLCDELITLPEESYRLWYVVVCDLETSWMRRPWPTVGLLRQKQTSVGKSRTGWYSTQGGGGSKTASDCDQIVYESKRGDVAAIEISFKSPC